VGKQIYGSMGHLHLINKRQVPSLFSISSTKILQERIPLILPSFQRNDAVFRLLHFRGSDSSIRP